MKTLQIDEKNARKLYPKAPAEFKQMLEDTFTKEFFSQDITDQIKSFEDACIHLELDCNEVLPYKNPSGDHQEALNAAAKLFTIAKALNGDWKVDWSDSSQYKYYPWFEKNPSGFGLSYDDCDGWLTITLVGSRLCFKTAKLAEYAGKQFIDIYNKFLM